VVPRGVKAATAGQVAATNVAQSHVEGRLKRSTRIQRAVVTGSMAHRF